MVAGAMAETSLPSCHNAAERARFYTQRVAKDLQAKTTMFRQRSDSRFEFSSALAVWSNYQRLQSLPQSLVNRTTSRGAGSSVSAISTRNRRNDPGIAASNALASVPIHLCLGRMSR